MNLVSVIIPVYNVEPFIRRCLDSVLVQTYTNLQIILIDDGSTDKSGLICDEYKEKDSRIIVVHKKNGGLSAARNSGLEIAEGDYITFLDSDDYIDKDMYEILIRDIQANDCDISVCGSRSVNIQGKVLKDNNVNKVIVLNQRETFYHFFKTMNSAVWNKMYRKDVISGLFFEEGRIHGEDLYFNVQTISRSKKVVFNSLSKHNYLKRDGSITMSKPNPKMFDQIILREKIKEIIYKEFPEFGYVADRWCFLARMNIARKIYLSDAHKDYINELTECKEYLIKNYKNVKSYLNKKEFIEYYLMIHFSCIYPSVMRTYLSKKLT